jgi:hypothetical protein
MQTNFLTVPIRRLKFLTKFTFGPNFGRRLAEFHLIYDQKFANLEKIHSKSVLVKIRLKRLNVRSSLSTTDFGRTNAKSGRNFSKLAEFHPNRRTITNHGSIFSQLGQNSTKIGI